MKTKTFEITEEMLVTAKNACSSTNFISRQCVISRAINTALPKGYYARTMGDVAEIVKETGNTFTNWTEEVGKCRLYQSSVTLLGGFDDWLMKLGPMPNPTTIKIGMPNVVLAIMKE